METNNHGVIEYPELVCRGCFFPVGNLKSFFWSCSWMLCSRHGMFISQAVFFCFSIAAILQFSNSKILWAKRKVIEVTHSGGQEGERQPVPSGASSCWCINLRIWERQQICCSCWFLRRVIILSLCFMMEFRFYTLKINPVCQWLVCL